MLLHRVNRDGELRSCFFGLSGVSLLGCYCFTTIGMSGTWLGCSKTVDPGHLRDDACRGLARGFETRFAGSLCTGRSRPNCDADVAFAALPAGSGAVRGVFHDPVRIDARQPVALVTAVFAVGMLMIRTLHSLLNRHYLEETRAASNAMDSKRFRGPLIVVGLLAVVVNLFPGAGCSISVSRNSIACSDDLNGPRRGDEGRGVGLIRRGRLRSKKGGGGAPSSEAPEPVSSVIPGASSQRGAPPPHRRRRAKSRTVIQVLSSGNVYVTRPPSTVMVPLAFNESTIPLT